MEQTQVTDDRRGWFVGVNALFLTLAYSAVVLRGLTRLKVGTKVGPDDWLIVLALVFLTGHVSCLFLTVQHGMGRHASLIEDKRAFIVTSLTAQIFYNLCIPTIKMSIICLYSRIFRRSTASPWFTPTLWVTALFVFLTTIPQCFLYVFQCVPIESLWTVYPAGYRVVCINFEAAVVAFGVISIITDWWILALPVPIVLGLQLERKAKWSICSLFLIGVFVCVISIVRLVYAKEMGSADPSWSYVLISVISTVECSCGILAACMPTFRPLFKSLRHRLPSCFGSSSNKSPSKGDSRLHSANTLNTGRARWVARNRSRSRGHPRTSNVLNTEHSGMGTGTLSTLTTGVPRSETSMSGSSIEKMLKGRDPDLDLQSKKSSPYTPSSELRAKSPCGTLSDESESKEMSGGRVRNSGLGIQGIVVTKTISS